MKTPAPTDWTEVRRQIDAARAAIETGFALSAEAERRLLKKRAQELAREPQAQEVAGDILETVEFELASEHYAIALAQVKEVSLLKELTPVPCAPPFVLGIINLRGEIRTVIDLKKFFDLPAKGITELNKIIIIQHDDMQVGILADTILGVRRIRLDELQPALPTLTGRRADYLRGITSERLVVLDAAKILSDNRILVNEEVSP
ncbi:MAG: chemotaxis protein CheW [Prosthecobacter sp.]|uniref:chemotaxis protein CheW n=1 Tax=Prosthecobacter sp. TaxID=1965333 RepID=UPI0038FE92EB